MLREYETVGSTMDMAREALLAGEVLFASSGESVAEPAGILAREQTAGRGQRGNHWFSPPGENLYLTCFLRCRQVERAGEFSFRAGVAVAETLRQNGAEGIGLKWPNDLMLNGKKVGGILIEMVQTPETGSVALVGVGVNLGLRSFPPELGTIATSLAIEGVLCPDAKTLGEQIAVSLNRFSRLPFPEILALWRTLDTTIGRCYRTDREGDILEGIATGIDAEGRLLLQDPAGRILPVASASSLREQL